MVTKHDISKAIYQIRQSGFSLDTSWKEGHVSATSRKLRKIQLVFNSPCRNVAVYMNGNGAIEDLILAEGSLSRLDYQQMASVIMRTIREAEETLKMALTAVIANPTKDRAN